MLLTCCMMFVPLSDLDAARPAATIWGEDEINLQRKDAIHLQSNIRTAVEVRGDEMKQIETAMTEFWLVIT